MRKRRTQNPTNIPSDFLTRSFDPSESIALFLRCTNPARTFQRIVPLERSLPPCYLGWLVHQSATGANIYVVADPLRSGSQKRTKERIAAVGICILIWMPTERPASHRSGPRTSFPRRTQSARHRAANIRFSGGWMGSFSSSRRVPSNCLRLRLAAIPLCTNCYRVLRLPGFLNCKYDPAYRVTVEYPGDSTSNPGGFRVDITKANPMLSSRAIPPRKHPDKHTYSERDWAWVLRQLSEEEDIAKPTRCMASSCSHTPSLSLHAANGRCRIGQTLAYQRSPMNDAVRSWESAAIRVPSHSVALVRGGLLTRRRG